MSSKHLIFINTMCEKIENARMKKFVVRILFFGIPIIVFLFLTEYLLRNIPNDYSYKNAYLKENAKNIETLFLGSSHAYYGINPKYFSGNSFNASHISQTIDLDYKLIDKYASDFKKLEYIVIPIDYFSLFTRTSTGIEAWRMKNYNIYYDLKASSNPKDYFELFSFSFKKSIQRITASYYDEKNNMTCSRLGYGIIDSKQADLIETGKTAAERHTKKDYTYLDESIEIINKIIDYAEKNNKTVLFYTSPAYSSYRNNLDSTQLKTTINKMDSISKNHINSFYINLLDDKSFIADDFRDGDHLNMMGAKKLTMMINSYIEKIKHFQQLN